MRSRSEAGVTLMELLVAMTLLSFLSVGMLFALRIGLKAMEQTQARLTSNRRAMGIERIFEQELAGFIPVHADCRLSPGSPAVIAVPFFQGEPQTMRFVSTYSLQEALRGYPRILEYQVIPGENGEGVRLVVNEPVYTGSLSTGQLCAGTKPDPLSGLLTGRMIPVNVGSNSFVLADQLAYCHFLFKEELPPPAPARWVERWLRASLPLAVRIEMAPLVLDSSKLQVSSVTAPFHVDRDLSVRYNE